MCILSGGEKGGGFGLLIGVRANGCWGGQDNIFMQIRGEGLDGEDAGGREEERVVFVLHPNCAVEEM